jgi:hypothetical protein
VDLGTITAAWSVAGLVSKVYAWLCGLGAILLLVTIMGGDEQPSEVVTDLLGWTAVSSSGPVAVARWIDERSDVVAASAQVVLVIGLLWSAMEVQRHPARFMDVRGPATAWLCSLLVVESIGVKGLREIVVQVVGACVLLLFLELLIRILARRVGRRVQGDWKTAIPIGLMTLGIVFTPLVPVFGAAYAAGGPTRG